MNVAVREIKAHYSEVEDLNQGIDIEATASGRTYTIPYSSAVFPFDWSDDCPPYLVLNAQSTGVASAPVVDDKGAESTGTTLHTSIVTRGRSNTQPSTPDLSSQDRTATSRQATKQTTETVAAVDLAAATTAKSETNLDTDIDVSTRTTTTPTTTVELRDARTASGQSLTSQPTMTCFSEGTEFSLLKQTLRDDNSIRFCGTQSSTTLSDSSPWVWRTYWLDATPYSQQFVISWIAGCQDNDSIQITGHEKCNSALREIGNTCRYGGYTDIGCLRYLTIPQDNGDWIQMRN
ncbi:hypothetical protein BGZ63DRAFT_458548 [Mariannaea sp. PMI_226]|nr:hypothetical protein BGZ63DRAFT_458548 [Mariannaea sp. PMI_226]